MIYPLKGGFIFKFYHAFHRIFVNNFEMFFNMREIET